MLSRGQLAETLVAVSPVTLLPAAPRTPTLFHSEVYEGVDNQTEQYEQVARHNGRTPEKCPQSVYFSLEGTAHTWYENQEVAITTWEACKNELWQVFGT